MVETSTRFEGLEIIWEKLFGHKGYFPDNHIRGLVQTPMMKKSENDPREVEKRNADNLVDLETLDSKVRLNIIKDFHPWIHSAGSRKMEAFEVTVITVLELVKSHHG